MNPAPRNVLHVIDSLDLGGAQTFLLDLVRNLDPARYRAEVAAMHGRGIYAPAFVEAGIMVHSLSPRKFPPLYFARFWNLMRTGKFDILHFHLFGANLCAKPLAIASGHPAIIVHDQCNDASRDRNPLLLAADAFWNRRSSRVIAVSGSVRRYLLDREDLPDSLVTMIPNGIDATQFVPPSEEMREKARRALGLPEEAFVVGGIGRLVPQKNFTVFLDAAARILRSRPDLLFVIAGTGPLERNLREQAATLGLGESVRFLGHVGDRIGLYRALDALMMTSDFEGTPMTLLEAMASALPVVASAVDGIAEVCSPRHDASLVRPGDAAGFAAALDAILRDPQERARLGESARRTILDRYDIRPIAKRIEQLYDEVLADGMSTL
jgi:glycosyltransferase involved in cell wall biosynthesis